MARNSLRTQTYFRLSLGSAPVTRRETAVLIPRLSGGGAHAKVTRFCFDQEIELFHFVHRLVTGLGKVLSSKRYKLLTREHR